MKDLFKSSEITKIEDCMTNSFVPSKDVVDFSLDFNPSLQAEIDSTKSSGIETWPSITLNHKFYTGEFLPSIRVVNAICETYTVKPVGCAAVEKEYNVLLGYDSETHYIQLAIVFLIVIFLLLVMLQCYKYMMKREMQKEINLQVNQTVSQYFSLKNKDESKQDNL